MGNINYDQKIHKLNVRLAKLKKRKRFQEQKEWKKIRRERAKKLLKLGLIFESTLTDIYSIQLIIGYLEHLKEVTEEELEYFKYKGNELLTEMSLEKYDKREVFFLDTSERKKRNHKLISLGALFEKTRTENYSLAIQMGYIDTLHSLTDSEITFYEITGKNILYKEKRKNG